jgi:hypothetical protein
MRPLRPRSDPSDGTDAQAPDFRAAGQDLGFSRAGQRHGEGMAQASFARVSTGPRPECARHPGPLHNRLFVIDHCRQFRPALHQVRSRESADTLELEGKYEHRRVDK